MSNSHADRNMLFGILALQMNFIEREDLIAAASAWIKDKSRTLAEILVRQHRLDARQRDLLEPLVDEHIRQHDDQPGKSLAAISSIGSLRQDLQSLDDQELQASLSHVASQPAALDPYTTLAVSLGQSSSHGERFRILRPHARGGLGQVSVALDCELNREVALKQIQNQFASNLESRARFTLEAEITGGLEHPGIVPVYGLGKYADGRPFYAMRFVRGDSLKQAIERFHAGRSRLELNDGERSVEFRRLVGRFVDVCDAVEYAHSRGVLHRDLKPGNIMLGKYGETLVVDWGLAKVGHEDPRSVDTEESVLRPSSESGSVPTQMGSAMGTPQYMSPEQAAGRLDQLGPTSDVYSLGATLYCLLSGQPPLTGESVEEMLGRARAGEFPRPGEIKSDVPKALEAVCLKAMSLKPTDRYRSPRAIAADIEHWLADEPVSACPDSVANRMARWLRHHRGLARATAAALIVITLLSVVSAVLINNERRRADQNAAVAWAAQRLAEQEKTRADENARTAGEQRDLTLETLQKLVYEVQDKLGDKPGMQKLKQEILDMAIEGLNKVARNIDATAHEAQLAAAEGDYSGDEAQAYIAGYEAGRQAATDHSLAIALRRMGDIFMVTGRTEQALEQFESSYRILRRLADDRPAWILAQQSLANANDKLGYVQRRMGKPTQAADYYHEAFRIRESLAATDPADPDGRYALAVAFSNLGDLQLHLDDYPGAFDSYRRSLNIRRELVNEAAEDPLMKRAWAYAEYELGTICLRIGLAEQALQHYQQSLDLRLEMAANDPEQAAQQQLVDVGYTGLGNALMSMDRFEEAQVVYQKRLELAEQSLAVDPESLRAKRALKLAHNRLGIVALQQGLLDPAREHFQSEIQWAERVADEDPGDAQWQTFLAASYSNLAMTEIRAGNLLEAARWSAKATLTEGAIRAKGKVTEWTGVPDWIDAPLKATNPRRGAVRVLDDLEFAESQPVELARDLLVFRTAVLAGRGAPDDAAASVQALERLAGEDVDSWYDAARCYAICAATQDKASADDRKWQDAAIRCLGTAIDYGFYNVDRLKTDPDLEPLREHPEYRVQLARVAPSEALAATP